jgi:DNA invertase Pin-like site-specific DNA recombinase
MPPSSTPQLIERFCSYRGLELVKIFSDIDYSAFRGAKARPALEELKARRAEFDAVIVPKLSRFGRSVKDLVRLFEPFDRDGIALTFLDMNIDTSTSRGRLLRLILAAFAEYESDVKSDYSRANLRMIASEGRPHDPRAPYGYIVVGKRRNKTYVIDKERAPLVREIFKLRGPGWWAAGLGVVLWVGPQIVFGITEGAVGPERSNVDFIDNNPAVYAPLIVGSAVAGAVAHAWLWRVLFTRRAG